jgi:hypothetical protein
MMADILRRKKWTNNKLTTKFKTMKKLQHFAAAGSVFHDELIIKGTVTGKTFNCKYGIFIMDGQKFWDDIGELAKRLNKFIYLKY